MRFVREQQDVNVARAACLTECNMEASDPKEDAPGHVSVIIVPGRPPEHPSKPLAAGELPEGAIDHSPIGIRLCDQVTWREAACGRDKRRAKRLHSSWSGWQASCQTAS